MKIGQYTRAEFVRCARFMYEHGDSAKGHLLSAVAAKTEVSVEQFDAAHMVFCDWITERIREQDELVRMLSLPRTAANTKTGEAQYLENAGCL